MLIFLNKKTKIKVKKNKLKEKKRKKSYGKITEKNDTDFNKKTEKLFPGICNEKNKIKTKNEIHF